MKDGVFGRINSYSLSVYVKKGKVWYHSRTSIYYSIVTNRSRALKAWHENIEKRPMRNADNMHPDPKTFLMTVRMCVTYLGNEREQHTQHNNADVAFG